MNRRLILVYITGLLIGISYGLHGPLLPIFAKNIIGASYAELGIIGFANFIPYIFFPLFVGIFLNRFNNGYLLSIGVVINSASVYLLSIAQSVPELMSFRVITGIAHAFFWPPCEAIISNVSKGKTRVRNIATFTGFFTTGFMIGPLFGSILLEGFDATYRIIFEIAAYVLIVSLVSALLLSKNRPTIKHEKFSLSSLKEIAKFPQVILLLIYCTASFGIILSIYPAFLNDRTMTVLDVEILFFIFGISRILTLAVAGKLAKNIIQHFLRHAIRDGFFHADRHQGNLFVTKDENIVPVDFGIMGRLDKNNRKYLAEILYGFIKRDYKKVA